MAELYVSRAGYATWAVYEDGKRVSPIVPGHHLAERALERLKRERRIKTRPCLTCGATFRSEGAHHRMCDYCRQRARGVDPQMLGV